jgi:hypothetical protein
LEQLMATTIKQKNNSTIPAALELSTEGRRHLAEFNLERNILRLRTKAVANRAQNGLVVHGPPGLGKTKTVRDTLDRLCCRYKYRDGVCTARGLFDLLDMNPAGVVVLDDLGNLLNDRAAVQILLAALGGEIGDTRPITWSKYGSDSSGDCVHFSGGVIAIANEALPDKPLCQALRSRVVCLEFNPTFAERKAVFRDYANQGHSCAAGSMEPTECRVVVEYVLEQVDALKKDAGVDQRIDFRTITRAYGDYLTCKGERKVSWQQAVLHDLRSAPKPKAVDTGTKKGRLELERIQFLKAKAENDRLPMDEQLSITELGKSLGISKGKAYGFLNGN